MNHFASPKAMEPVAAVDLFTRGQKSNVKLSVYTGDDDSTTAAYIRQKVPYTVEKRDRNHSCKKISYHKTLKFGPKRKVHKFICSLSKSNELFSKMFQLQLVSKQGKSITSPKNIAKHCATCFQRSHKL